MAQKRRSLLRRAANLSFGLPARTTLRVVFGTAVGLGVLVCLGLPLPITEIMSSQSIWSAGLALGQTVSVAGGLLLEHGGLVSLASLLGGWLAYRYVANGANAILHKKDSTRPSFVSASLRDTVRVPFGALGMLAGTWLGAKGATLVSSNAARIHDTSKIIRQMQVDIYDKGSWLPWQNLKPKGVEWNVTTETVANAATENMRQGWSIILQGLGNSPASPEFWGAILVLGAALGTMGAALNPRGARRVIGRSWNAVAYPFRTAGPR